MLTCRQIMRPRLSRRPVCGPVRRRNVVINLLR